MKKIVLIVSLLMLVGCSEFNERFNDHMSWEKEKSYCVSGKQIWVLERGNDERINITSEIVGECNEE